ncbi:MAG: GNAT family N-acetyltransferase [Hyphomonadaceae bacterium]|jgi:GNAT superfamily N-acetyltransferase
MMMLPADHIAAGLVIVFEHWGEAAGFVVVVPREDGKADLGGPFVEPDLWRGGIGRKLVDEAVQFAMALEAAELLASASPRAEPFYEKCGFVPMEKIVTTHGPVAVMSRTLID